MSASATATTNSSSTTEVSIGWVYCFSNPSMPGILKVGMTARTPEERAKELFTTAVPLPFKIEFAKRVSDPLQKEMTLHDLLEKYTDRINSRREFFRVSQEEVRKLCDLMDGEMWAGTREEEEEEEEEDTSESALRTKATSVMGCRDMTKCFKDGQRIRHTIKRINDTWIGTYDSSKNGIVYDEKFYKTMAHFANTHGKIDNLTNQNGWITCECEVDGEWKSTSSLPEL